MGKKSLRYYFWGGLDKIGRVLYPRYKRNKVILFRYTTALGDALMLTTLAREVKKRNPNAYIHVVTGVPVIFERNPDINEISPEPKSHVDGLGKYLIRYEHQFPWEKHILNSCAEIVDINDAIELKTYIYPTVNDFKFAKDIINNSDLPPILINRKAGPRTDKKNWPDNYWNILIQDLTQKYFIIEIGGTEETATSTETKNYINLTGKTSIHQSAALMSVTKLLVCPVTGLLHLASAYNLTTLCILGGSEPAIGTKYTNTHFIESRPACADCYEQGPCNFEFICLHDISPKMVFSRINELMEQR